MNQALLFIAGLTITLLAAMVVVRCLSGPLRRQLHEIWRKR
jgi:hypothetical protein